MSIFKQKKNLWIASIFILFGLVTVMAGGRALFTESGIQTRGQIVPLVLWFNFIAGFFYVLTGVLTYHSARFAKKWAIGLAGANLLVLAYLLNYIYQGGLYETKTLIAMSFRTVFWVTFATYFLRSVSSSPHPHQI